jgi:hypothetical protein
MPDLTDIKTIPEEGIYVFIAKVERRPFVPAPERYPLFTAVSNSAARRRR